MCVLRWINIVQLPRIPRIFLGFNVAGIGLTRKCCAILIQTNVFTAVVECSVGHELRMESYTIRALYLVEVEVLCDRRQRVITPTIGHLWSIRHIQRQTISQRDFNAIAGRSPEEFGEAIATGKTTKFTFEQPFPVYVAYWTVIPNAAGTGVSKLADIYGRDAPVVASFAKPGRNAAVMISPNPPAVVPTVGAPITTGGQ